MYTTLLCVLAWARIVGDRAGGETAGEDYLISFSLFFMSAAQPVGRTVMSVWEGGRTEGTLF